MNLEYIFFTDDKEVFRTSYYSFCEDKQLEMRNKGYEKFQCYCRQNSLEMHFHYKHTD